MARRSSPDSIYRISLHRNAGHLYAATHPFTLDASGKRKYSVIHWGTVTDDLRFIPGKRYLEASGELRDRLVFPEEWDLSAIEGTVRIPDKASYALPFHKGDENKSFGDVWLLERIADHTGLREDLAKAFGVLADDLLTLAYYPFLTGMSFLRFARWQFSTKVPSERPLETMLADSFAGVTRAAFRQFMELRLARYAGERLCTVDSITRLSSGMSVSDRRWGQKTERIHFQTIVEAVAYSLDDHIPVAYSSFPEAVTDARGIGIFRGELDKVGLKGSTIVTDRGYDSLQGLEKYYGGGPMVMCVDVKQPAVMERIKAFGRFRSHPAGMRYDAASRRWYRQFRLDRESPSLRLNLFFNPERRAAELAQIDAEIASQHNALKEIVEYGIAIADRHSLRRENYFFKTSYDSINHTVTGFSPDKARILETRAASGFYANVTTGLKTGPLEAVSIYGLKYDQEKFLRQFRSLLDFPQRPSASGGLSFGVQILQYIGLLFNTWLRHSLLSAPQGASLPYSSIMEMLDDYHDIPCADAGDGTCVPAGFTSSQQDALAILGL